MQKQHPHIIAEDTPPASPESRPESTVTHEVLNLVAANDEFKGRWESLGQLLPVRLVALQRVAAMESAAATARLAGFRCTDRRVGEYLAGKSVKQADLSLNVRLIVKGYNNVLKLVHSSYPQIAFIENHVRQLHDLMLGNTRTVNPQEPTELSLDAAQLIKDTDQLLREGPLHPLLVIADFSCRFRSIKPFSEGNNRLTWLLSRLLLLRSGYSFVSYCSLEHFIEKTLPEYEKLSGNGDQPNDHHWLVMFLKAMSGARADLTARIEHEKEVLKLANPYREIIRVVQEHGRSTISRIMESTGVNRNTLKIRLRKLVGEKYLVQHGSGKGTYYTIQGLHLQ
ncbi:MAG: Fic family protein [Proteobacteria bacterium]|nr:Fic family protein [Pseudomonadota bacterium]MBU1736519.1 Fic family protein [Pseudomonadota bacterium]